VKDVLLNLKLGKAVGNDKISHNMLKHTASTVCKPLEIIFNCSLQTGRFPHMWKSAIWICHKTLNKLFHDFPKPNKYYGKFLLIDALWNVYA
jgi:hypothetical protein